MDESDNRNQSQPIETLATEATFDVPATAEARGHGPGFLLGVVVGALVGAGLATIFTPVSGEQARLRTAEKAPELWRRRDELAQEARDKAHQVTGGIRSRLQEALDSGREAAQEAQQEARRRFEQMTGRRSGPPLP
jgi:gas vesicle protein